MGIMNKLIGYGSISVATPITIIAEEIIREKIESGKMDYNLIAGSLNDFTIPYFMTIGILSLAGKIKEKYQVGIATLLPTIFTINEFFPFISARDSGLADVYDPKDIIAFWSAGALAYLTAKVVNSDVLNNLFKKRTLEDKVTYPTE